MADSIFDPEFFEQQSPVWQAGMIMYVIVTGGLTAVALGLFLTIGLPSLLEDKQPVAPSTPSVSLDCYDPAAWDHSGCPR